VRVEGRFYGVPWGREVDWSQPPEAGDEVLIDDDMETLHKRIRDRVTE